MSQQENTNNLEELEVDLREPMVAAALAWLLPGAGHLYQRRYRKGLLFMICILGTFFFGLILGNGHVVYASWRPNDYRWQSVPQLGTGLVAVPAIIQSYKVKDGSDPHWITAYRYPRGHEKQYQVIPEEELEVYKDVALVDGFMAPPDGDLHVNDPDVLSAWHDESSYGFEIGTLYTVVAGLLNILAIYDAFAGPVLPPARKEDEEPDEDKNRDEKSKK